MNIADQIIYSFQTEPENWKEGSCTTDYKGGELELWTTNGKGLLRIYKGDGRLKKEDIGRVWAAYIQWRDHTNTCSSILPQVNIKPEDKFTREELIAALKEYVMAAPECALVSPVKLIREYAEKNRHKADDPGLKNNEKKGNKSNKSRGVGGSFWRLFR